nr:diguanylate cyclase [uncultured Holophaga sp.]
MFRTARCFALLLVLASGLPLATSEPAGLFRFRLYGAEQGLRDATFTSLAQDRTGFLWVGTETGLLRFDGHRFRKWGRREGLPESHITLVEADPVEGVWITTAHKGVFLFRGGVFHPPVAGGQPLVPSPASLIPGWDGGLWMLREDGLYRQTDAQVFRRVTGVPAPQGMACATPFTRHSLLFFSAGRLWELFPDRGRWEERGRLEGFPEALLNGFQQDASGRTWLVGTRALAYLDPDLGFHPAQESLRAAVFPRGQVRTGPGGRVWIPTDDGLLALRGGEYQKIDRRAGLPTPWVNTSLVDREGNLWVAGTCLARQLDQGHVRLFRESEGLPSDMVWAIHRDRRGQLWAGTNSGLARLGALGWHRVPGTEGMVIYALGEDPRGRLWVVPNGRAPFRVDPLSGRILPAGLGHPVRTAYADREGGLWFSPSEAGGIWRLDGAGRLREEVLPAGAVQGRLEVSAFLEDEDGCFWVATNQGLLCRNASGWHAWTQRDGLRETSLDGLASAGSGGVWVYYSEPSGATRVHARQGRLQVLEQLDAPTRLPSDLVYAMGVDRQGRVWVSTDKGIVAVQGDRVLRMGLGPERVADEGNGGALLVEPGGDVWVGTTRGMLHILGGQEPPPVPPPVAVILSRGWLGYQEEGGGAGVVSIPRSRSTLEFRFCAVSYADESALRYQVRLLGLEDSWRDTDINEVRYPSMPPGDYRFEVRAGYPGEPFGLAAVSLFRVERPWWQTWWAVAGVAILGGGVVHLWVRWRLIRLAAAKARLEATVLERTQALRRVNGALQEANLALEKQSLTDPLTGLKNRRFLALTVENDTTQVLRAYRERGHGRALANQDLVFFAIDLDFFKQINDRYGHGVGDRILERTAQLLRRVGRESDAVIRMGGEEFLVLARGCSREEAPVLAERIRGILEQASLQHGGESIHWTASLGFAPFPFQPGDVEWVGWEEVLDIADACLYAAKQAGRNAWVGVQAGAGLDRATHGSRIPLDLGGLVREGVLEVVSSFPDPFGA